MSLPVIITYSNYGYKDFALNVLHNFCDIVKQHKLIFYCLDEEIYNFCNEMLKELQTKYISYPEIKFIKWYKTVNKSFQNYGTKEYNQITHTKMSVLKDALNEYNYIHFIDADVVILKEPSLEYWNKYNDYDVVFQDDAPTPGVNVPFSLWSCTGNFTLRNTEKTINFLDSIEEWQKIHPENNDQECMYNMLKQNYNDLRDVKEVKLYQYPMCEFMCGYIITHNLMNTEKTYFFHANHVQGNFAKINLLKCVNKWYLKN